MLHVLYEDFRICILFDHIALQIWENNCFCTRYHKDELLYLCEECFVDVVGLLAMSSIILIDKDHLKILCIYSVFHSIIDHSLVLL